MDTVSNQVRAIYPKGAVNALGLEIIVLSWYISATLEGDSGKMWKVFRGKLSKGFETPSLWRDRVRKNSIINFFI